MAFTKHLKRRQRKLTQKVRKWLKRRGLRGGSTLSQSTEANTTAQTPVQTTPEPVSTAPNPVQTTPAPEPVSTADTKVASSPTGSQQPDLDTQQESLQEPVVTSSGNQGIKEATSKVVAAINDLNSIIQSSQ
jgi:hypothetical protein